MCSLVIGHTQAQLPELLEKCNAQLGANALCPTFTKLGGGTPSLFPLITFAIVPHKNAKHKKEESVPTWTELGKIGHMDIDIIHVDKRPLTSNPPLVYNFTRTDADPAWSTLFDLWCLAALDQSTLHSDQSAATEDSPQLRTGGESEAVVPRTYPSIESLQCKPSAPEAMRWHGVPWGNLDSIMKWKGWTQGARDKDIPQTMTSQSFGMINGASLCKKQTTQMK